MGASEETFPFHAFISYKRGGDDEKFAVWLQRRLERFRIPAAIPDKDGNPAPSPVRRFRVFRDKSDLGSHTNVVQGLNKSLSQCRYLVVVCSPRSARSEYVAQEVEYFQNNGRKDYIIPFIIDGRPDSDDAEVQCYPPSMGPEVLGVILAEGTKEEALIKTTARLLHMDYHTLYQRHLRAQRRTMVIALGIAFSAFAVLSGLTVWALNAERRANEQRLEAEGLVKFLTFDLRREVFDHIPVRARELVTDKVEDYYRKWGVTGIESRFNNAVHLVNQSQISYVKGQYDQTDNLAAEALKAITALRRELPDNPEIMRREAQVTALQGAMLLRGKDGAKQAQRHFEKSMGIVRQLSEQEPGSIRNTELAVSILPGLIGSLEMQGREKDVVGHEEHLVDLRKKLYESDPSNLEYLSGLGDSQSGLCTRFGNREDPRAIPACEAALETARLLLEADPHSEKLRSRVVFTLYGLHAAHLNQWHLDRAFALLDEIARQLDVMVRDDPDNTEFQAIRSLVLLGRAIQELLRPGSTGSSEEALLGEAKRVHASLPPARTGDVIRYRLELVLASAEKLHGKWNMVARNRDEIEKTVAHVRKEWEKHPGNAQLARQYVKTVTQAGRESLKDRRLDDALRHFIAVRDFLENMGTRYPRMTPPVSELVQAHLDVAWVYQQKNEIGHAVASAQEAVTLARNQQPEGGGKAAADLIDALYRIARLANEQGRFSEAAVVFDEAAAVGKEHFGGASGDPLMMLSIRTSLLDSGMSSTWAGEYEKGIAAMRDALDHTRRLVAGHAEEFMGIEGLQLIEALRVLAAPLEETGRHEEADALFSEAVDRLATVSVPRPFRASVDSTSFGVYYETASMHLGRGQTEQARIYVEKLNALKMPDGSGSELFYWKLLETGLNLELLVAEGRWEDARTLYRGMKEMVERERMQPEMSVLSKNEISRFFNLGGAVSLHFREMQDALGSFGIVLDTIGNHVPSAPAFLNPAIAEAHAGIGAVLMIEGKSCQAAKRFTESIAVLAAALALEPRHIRWNRQMAENHEALADALAQMGQGEDAAEARRKALSFREKTVTE